MIPSAASSSERERVNRSSVSVCASSPSDVRRLMIDSTSSRLVVPRTNAAVACPASWVATARRSSSVYTLICFNPTSSASFASYTSERFIPFRPSRSPTRSDSSIRCSIITGV